MTWGGVEKLMLNDRLVTLSDYPFDRLRTLLRGLEPPSDRAQIGMHIGEPKHDPPPMLAATIQANAAEWNKYPPPAGNDDLKEARSQIG